MPLYDFKCAKCGKVEEYLFKPNTKKEIVSCPTCPGKMKRQMGVNQLKFIGMGWYNTDHKKKYLGKKDRKGRSF